MTCQLKASRIGCQESLPKVGNEDTWLVFTSVFVCFNMSALGSSVLDIGDNGDEKPLSVVGQKDAGGVSGEGVRTTIPGGRALS